MPVTIEKTNQLTQAPVPRKTAAQVSSRLAELARLDSAEVLRLLETSVDGVTSEAAAERLEQYGPNEVAREKRHGWLQRLYVAARNPLVILLTVLAIISFVAHLLQRHQDGEQNLVANSLQDAFWERIGGLFLATQPPAAGDQVTK